MKAEEVAKKAHEYEKKYHGCAQCTLRALQDCLGFGSADTFKAATAFSGGIAYMNEECGALTGGLMALGIVFGREKLESTVESADYVKTLELAAKLYKRFKQHFGSTKCRDIQTSLFGRSFDLKKPKDREEFIKAGGYEKCPEVAMVGAQLAAEIILEEKQKRDVRIRCAVEI